MAALPKRSEEDRKPSKKFIEEELEDVELVHLHDEDMDEDRPGLGK